MPISPKVQAILSKLSPEERNEFLKVMGKQSVPEIDILVAVGIWLHSNGWHLHSISIPKGSGMKETVQRQKVSTKFSDAGVPLDDLRFIPDGPDIIAIRDPFTWKIECKGLGMGTSQTFRNNFDRALASVVSYYTCRKNILLGLAMPKNNTYYNLIKNKIPSALREAINLWILLYDQESNSSVKAIEPTVASVS